MKVRSMMKIKYKNEKWGDIIVVRRGWRRRKRRKQEVEQEEVNCVCVWGGVA